MAELPDLAGLPDAGARRRAVERLDGVAPPASEEVDAFLFAALGDDDYGVRHAAVKLATRWHSFVGSAALERALCDEMSLSRRSAAMEAFGQLKEAAVSVLDRVARQSNAGVRRLAVDALGLTRCAAAERPLSRLADDPSPAVRAAALEALSRVGGEGAAARVQEVCARRDEPASVVLAGLLALDALALVLPPASMKPHLTDPLTAAPALRLLGRAGEPEPLVDVLAHARGARARAAAIGLGLSLTANPDHTRAVLKAARARIEEPLLALAAGRDLPAAGAALHAGAEAGVADVLAHVALRSDRGLLLGAAHRAVVALGGHLDVGRRLRALRSHATDVEAIAFFDELIEGMGEGLGRRLVPAGAKPRAPSAPSFLSATQHSVAPMTPAEFASLAGLFLRVAGLQFEDHAAYRLEARLLPRLRARAVASWARYIALLGESHADARDELSLALDRVTVHETYFFRERYQLDEFSARVLPGLTGQSRKGLDELLHLESGPLRVLSAGCSTGEEAWTLAILIEESGLFAGMDFEIVGIDISPSSVESAQKARYGRRGFRGDAPDGLLDKWFVQEGAQRTVAESLRSKVRFTVGNLIDPNHVAALGRFHIIFCRNVMIYMSDEARARVLGQFRERLWPGGVLFLGHSESLLNMDTGFRFLPLERELVYVRPRDGGTP